MSDLPLEKAEQKYSINLTLDELKFTYTSCIANLLQLEDKEFYEQKSVSRLQACVALFEEIEKHDPKWLVSNGFAYDRGFHLSWLEWFHTLRENEQQ